MKLIPVFLESRRRQGDVIGDGGRGCWGGLSGGIPELRWDGVGNVGRWGGGGATRDGGADGGDGAGWGGLVCGG